MEYFYCVQNTVLECYRFYKEKGLVLMVQGGGYMNKTSYYNKDMKYYWEDGRRNLP